MKKTILLLLSFVSLGAFSQTDYYVTTTGATENNGLAWSSPKDLTSALATAIDGDIIHVAAGTYVPTNNPVDASTDDRDKCFLINTNVSLIGGYTENPLVGEKPDANVNKTILSGLIAAPSTRVYHVVVVTAPKKNDQKVSLSGITVTMGQAWGGTSYNPAISGKTTTSRSGSALFAVDTNIELDNCVFTGNKHLEKGAVYFLNNTTANMINCLVQNNKSIKADRALNGMGGGVCTYTNAVTAVDCPVLTMDNCIVDNNQASNGAGIYLYGWADVTISNSKVTRNYAKNGSGGIYAREGATVKVNNCYVAENMTVGGVAGGLNAFGNATKLGKLYIYNSLIEKNIAGATAEELIFDVENSADGGAASSTLRQPGEAIGARTYSEVYVVNCTMSNNTGRGTIYTDGAAPGGGKVFVISSTIVDNNLDVYIHPTTAKITEPIGAVAVDGGAAATIYNSLVANNLYKEKEIAYSTPVKVYNSIGINSVYDTDGKVIDGVTFNRAKMLASNLSLQEGKQGYYKLIETDDEDLAFYNPALDKGMTPAELSALAKIGVDPLYLAVDQQGMSRTAPTLGAATIDKTNNVINANANQALTVYSHNGILFVNAENAAVASIHSTSGQLLKEINVNSGWSMIEDLTAGNYIIVLEGKSYVVAL